MAKGPEAFRTISEAAEEVGVPAHVLRFWETRFSIIRPMKRAGGRRFYRPQDVALLRTLRVLLHDQGRSIRDVQQLSRSEGVRALGVLADGVTPVIAERSAPEEPPAPQSIPASGRPDEAGLRRLAAARDDLLAIKRRLDALLSG